MDRAGAEVTRPPQGSRGASRSSSGGVWGTSGGNLGSSSGGRGGGGGGDMRLESTVSEVGPAHADEPMGMDAASTHLVADSTQFSVTIQDLQHLVEARERDDEFVTLYQRMGHVQGICAALKTDKNGGIMDTSKPGLKARREWFGENVMPSKQPQPYWKLVLECLADTTLIMLSVAAVVSLVLGIIFEDPATGWIEGVAILVSIVIVVNVTAGNDYVKERQFLKLNASLEDADVNVLRGGAPMKVKVQQLLVGDVVQLNVGDNLHTDGVVIVSNSLKADESSQTGETDLVPKSPEKPILLSGTTIMEGSGRMVVVAVGRYSQAGIIKQLILHGNAAAAVASTTTAAASQTARAPAYDVEAAQASTAGSVGGTGTAGNPMANAVAAETIVSQQAAQAVATAPPAPGGSGSETAADDDDGARSVLAAKLDRVAVGIGKAGFAVALVCVIVMVVKHLVAILGDGGRGWNTGEDLVELLTFVIIGITILVVAVPEGLPLAVTLSLAFSGRRMQSDNNLVKHLDACETMGSATTICTDKTGTLTTNRMTVMDGHGLDTKIVPLQPGETPGALPRDYVQALVESVALNSGEASYVEKLPDGTWKYNGNPTECALLKWVTEGGADFKAVRKDPKFRYDHPLKVFPFSSARKRSSFIAPLTAGDWSFRSQGQPAGAVADTDGGSEAKQQDNTPSGTESHPSYRVFCKGASERVIVSCDRAVCRAPDGQTAVRWLSDREKTQLQKEYVEKYAEDGLRTIAIAYKDLTVEEVGAGGIEHVEPEVAEENLVLLGFVGIEDPVRPEVPAAIARCRKSGITVIMVTGDHIKTARSIAHKCGILNKDDHVYKAIDGTTFRARVMREDGSVNQEEFDALWPTLRVLARSTPSDKFALVRGLQASNLFEIMQTAPGTLPAPIYPDRQVVAVTGDGTNDAPALSRSDVGFAMGIQGTAVAKAACDIVLLDDNFSSIVQAVKWGRNVYDSVAKFLQFQLTVNIAAVVLAAVSALWLNESPLRAVQMLWVNLIMDSLASLALATEPPSNALLDRQPYGRNRPILSRRMWLFMIGHAFYQLFATFWLLVRGAQDLGIPDGRGRSPWEAPTQHFTIIFNAFVMMQLFNEINARKLHGEINVFEGLFRNWIFLLILLLTAGVQVVIVLFAGRAISVTPLTGYQWLLCVLLGVGELPWHFFLNLIPRCLPASWFREDDLGVPTNMIPKDDPIRRTLSAQSGMPIDRNNSTGSAGSAGFPLRSASRRQQVGAMLKDMTSHGQRYV